MSFLGLSLTDWTAIAAFAGVALAAATVAAIITGIRTAKADRKRDDAKRAEDRQWDSDRRAEDRERDDRLRREAADEWDRRNRAEQRAREDYEARQVTTEVIAGGQLSQVQRVAGLPQPPGRDFNHRIVVSAPVTFPVKWVDVQIVHNSSGNVALRPAGHAGDPASTENGRVYYRFWAEIPERLFEPFPIVRFVDQHGNLYYSLRGHTWRFPQNTEPISAASQIDKWIRTGPKPRAPDAMKERGLPLPVAFPRVHARGVYVIYDDGRPLVEAYDGPQIVGMDLHRRRSVLVRMTEDGQKLGTARITNSPARLAAEIARAGLDPKVVLEACYGWYWAADTLAAAGAEVHLAHPLGVKAFSHRRVKNDELDARDLADLLRMGRLAEAWIAPPEIRELREITRYRCKLVHIRTGCKDQVHGVLAKLGIEVTCSDIFGAWGTQWLDELPLPQPYSWKVASLRQLISWLTSEITVLEQVTADLLAGHDGYRAVQELPGIGPVLGAVIVAEIGDITRFRHPARLSSWAGLTPRHYESDTKVIRGRITKQGSRPLRWAVIEAVQRTPAGTPVHELKDAIIARRGIQARNIAKVAAARKLLTCVFYAMRDGHVRSLTARTAQQEAR